MKKPLAAILVAALTVAMALATVVGIKSATIRISRMDDPAWRFAATVIEILAGILWLLGAVFVATRLAVLMFGKIKPGPHQSSNLPPQV